MRVTLDTAILIRTNAKAIGFRQEFLDALKRAGTVLVLSPFILSEVERVLRYPRVQAIYHLTDADIQEHIRNLQEFAEVVTPFEGPPVILKDPNDDPVVYTALAGATDVICTLDRHFFEPNVLSFCSKYGISVMDDVELLQMLRRGEF